MTLNLKVFVVFHEKIYPEIYEVSDERTKYLTFYGVKNEHENKTPMDIVDEKDLPLYEPIWQNLHYNEASALYHIYKNRIHCHHEFIGFFQYDMKVLSNCFSEIEEGFKTNKRTIFYYQFFPWAFLGGQTIITTDYSCLQAGLRNYNIFFNTNFTEEQLIAFKMPIGNTFVVRNSMFDKMMYWMSQYYINSVETKMECTNGHSFNPGHIIEALTSMFLCLEVIQGAEYKQLSIYSDPDYKLSPL